MTEYELVTLLSVYADSLWARLGIFASILSAYLVAVFFASNKLPKWIMISITVIYSLFASLAALGIFTTIARAGLAREEIMRLYPASENIIVQGLANTAISTSSYMAAYLTVTLGSYLGSILFLIYELRKGNDSTQSDT